MKPRTRGRARLLCVCFSLLVLSGCASVPEVGPFAQATAEVRSAVVTAGATAEAELRRMEGGEQYADRLQAQWKTRVKAVGALVDYTDSLQSIVEAGQQGGDTADALADSVTRLAGAAGIALPAAGTVDVATDTARFVYQHIARMRAAKSLEASLEASQPAVEQIAQTIALDLRDAAGIFQAANQDLKRQLNFAHNEGLGFRESLIEERKRIYGAGAENLTQANKQRLLEIDELLVSTNDWYQPLQQRRNEIDDRLAASQALFNAATETVSQWGLAHAGLVAAVQERRPVNARSLAQAAADLRTLITRVREL